MRFSGILDVIESQHNVFAVFVFGCLPYSVFGNDSHGKAGRLEINWDANLIQAEMILYAYLNTLTTASAKSKMAIRKAFQEDGAFFAGVEHYMKPKFGTKRMTRTTGNAEPHLISSGTL